MERSLFDEILLDAADVRQLGPLLFSSIPVESRAAAYDRKAPLYDAIVGRSLYHRVFWGTSAGAFTRLARDAVDATDGGWFGEAGCGSLLFTHSLHSRTDGPPTVLIDRSLRMLRRGAQRLGADSSGWSGRLALLQSDVAALPLRSGVVRSLLSLNLLHVPCDAIAIVREIGRILQPARGRLFLSCLVRSGRWSDAYFELLHRAGELRAPWTPDELEATVTGDWGVVESKWIDGSMCFMVIRHAG